MATGEPTWYTYTIGGGESSGSGGEPYDNRLTWTGGSTMWGDTTYIRPTPYAMPYKEYTAAELEEFTKQYDFSKLGIPFKSQVEITKAKLEKIREAMAKYVVVVEIEGTPSAVIPAERISDLYNAIKDIVEK
jgi:hypothetical protein